MKKLLIALLLLVSCDTVKLFSNISQDSYIYNVELLDSVTRAESLPTLDKWIPTYALGEHAYNVTFIITKGDSISYKVSPYKDKYIYKKLKLSK